MVLQLHYVTSFLLTTPPPPAHARPLALFPALRFHGPTPPFLAEHSWSFCQQISKSVGRIICPQEQLAAYGKGPMRYFLMKRGRLQDDVGTVIAAYLSRCTRLRHRGTPGSEAEPLWLA